MGPSFSEVGLCGFVAFLFASERRERSCRALTFPPLAASSLPTSFLDLQSAYSLVWNETADVFSSMLDSEGWDKAEKGIEIKVVDFVEVTMRLALIVIGEQPLPRLCTRQSQRLTYLLTLILQHERPSPSRWLGTTPTRRRRLFF